MNNTRGKIVSILLLSSLFGLASGLIGAVIAGSYILENSYNIPLFGDIQFSNDNYGASGVVISNPKKVVVEQNARIAEVAKIAEDSIVGIFKTIESQKPKINLEKNEDAMLSDINNYYDLGKELGQGFVITSDGWIVSSFVPEEIKKISVNAVEKQELVAEISKKYIIITSKKEQVLVDDIIYDKNLDYAFWHVKATNLPVKKFASEKDIHNGQLVVAINWKGWISPATILTISNQTTIYSSDRYVKELTLAQSPEDNFFGAFVFDLNGDLAALIDNDGKLQLISNFSQAINSLLTNKEIIRASLGVNYIDLSNFVSSNSNNIKGALVSKDSSGFAVIKDSPAFLAGLLEGDIITAVDNVELNEDISLNSIIVQHQVGDEVTLEYLRGGEKKSVVLILAELE